jgi:peptidoglycan/xylan/chitin deacetylase (PgdA/CDA1 family)
MHSVQQGTPATCARDDVWLVNPGSVGQSRDRQPHARYALLDFAGRDEDRATTVSFASLSYDHDKTIAKLRLAGLEPIVAMPPPTALRRVVVRARAALKSLHEAPASVVDAPGLHESPAMTSAVSFPAARWRRRGLRFAQRALHATGLDRVIAPGGGAVILCYHGISSPEDSAFLDPRYAVRRDVFEQQMRFLARERNVLPLADLIDRLQRGAHIPRHSVVVTFDDGYRSTIDVAAPTLQHFGLDAVVYLPTAYVTDARPQYIDELYRMFTTRTRHALDLAGVIGGADLSDPQRAGMAYLRTDEYLSRAGPEDRSRTLQLVHDQLRPRLTAPRLTLTWDEVARLGRRYPRIDVGVHTRHHVDLTTCTPAGIEEEISVSIADVRSATGRTPRHHSFPFGRSCTQSREAARRAALSSAVVTEPAGVVRHGADLYHLPRLTAPTTMELFPLVTSGTFPDASATLFRRV